MTLKKNLCQRILIELYFRKRVLTVSLFSTHDRYTFYLFPLLRSIMSDL